MFLFGHLIYATGFMFLISWRGYWQELIETLVWAHEPGLLTYDNETPRHRLRLYGQKPL